MSLHYDAVIVGAGIAGASLAAELAPNMSVLMLEAEAQPGYHATGRSAAFWSETYGGPAIQPLTTASFDFLNSPPPEIAEASLLITHGAIHLGGVEDASALSAFADGFAGSGVMLEPLDRTALEHHLSGLKPAWDRALYEPRCAEIDVAALHQGWLAQAKRMGAVLRCKAAMIGASYRAGKWKIETAGGNLSAGLLINAAGAWVDPVAMSAGIAPLGITPYRRTIAQLRMGVDVPRDLPLMIDVNEQFYFKSDGAGGLWLSPHDETPSAPMDAAPEELDVAIAIDRLEHVVDWPVQAVTHKWAGLRSFAPDRLPVYGRDIMQPALFWFAGQGGFGIQTAPAAAKLAAHLIVGGTADPMISSLDPERYAAARFT